MAFECKLNSFLAYRESRFDFPTAESPIITTLNKYSSPPSSSDDMFACRSVIAAWVLREGGREGGGDRGV